MENKDFAIAFSQREGEEAIKEVSLKIKRIFPKRIDYLILLFTPHYTPSHILKTVNFTLKPKKLFCLQAPWLIFEDKSVQKGVVACCINKEQLYSHEAFLEAEKAEEIESFFYSAFKNLKKRNYSFLSYNVNCFMEKIIPVIHFTLMIFFPQIRIVYNFKNLFIISFL